MANGGVENAVVHIDRVALKSISKVQRMAATTTRCRMAEGVTIADIRVENTIFGIS